MNARADLRVWAMLVLLAIPIASCSVSTGGDSGGGGDGNGNETPPQALNATIVSPADDQEIEPGDALSFQGSYTGGISPFGFAWNFDQDGAGGGPETSDIQNPGSIEFESEGDFTVRFTVTAGNGETDFDEIGVLVADGGGNGGTDVTPPSLLESPQVSSTIAPPGSSVDVSLETEAGTNPIDFVEVFLHDDAGDEYDNATLEETGSYSGTLSVAATRDVNTYVLGIYLEDSEGYGTTYYKDNEVSDFTYVMETNSPDGETLSIVDSGLDAVDIIVGGAVYYLETFATAAISTDTTLAVYDDEMNLLAEDNDSGSGVFSRLQVNLLDDMDYFIRVKGFDIATNGPYSLRISPDGYGGASSGPDSMSVDAYEPDNDQNAARRLLTDYVQDHALVAEDEDWLVFNPMALPADEGGAGSEVVITPASAAYGHVYGQVGAAGSSFYSITGLTTSSYSYVVSIRNQTAEVSVAVYPDNTYTSAQAYCSTSGTGTLYCDTGEMSGPFYIRVDGAPDEGTVFILYVYENV